MIPFEKAYEEIMDSANLLERERVPFSEALDRVLAEDVVADTDMPPFPKSAMDGYACRMEDVGADLEVIESIPAGFMPSKGIGPNQCSKIMTGAPIPNGATVVIPVEDVEELADAKIRRTKTDTPRRNICAKAEDLKRGDVVLKKGEWISPAHVAVLAAVGAVTPLVSRRPNIAVIPTGDELIDPHKKIDGAHIRNSNGPQLCAQITKAGALPSDFGITSDTPESLDKILVKAEKNHDMIILTGGVSMGDFDFVPAVLKKRGFKLAFESVSMKPGKPLVFGSKDKIYCCGLPGNPVSSFVVFEIMLKPFIHKLMGHQKRVQVISAILEKNIYNKNSDRHMTIPVSFSRPGYISPIEYHGSAHINAIAMADALITLPRGIKEFQKGESVDVRLI